MPGLLVLVQGQAEIVDRDGRVQVNVTRLLPGDVAGEHEVVSRTPAATGLVVTSAAAFLSIPMRVARALCADEPAAREWLVALIAKRAEEFDRLDTGEVVLLDE
jgi:CRP-like cAMP-binding protein